jgi:hypothetical protein
MRTESLQGRPPRSLEAFIATGTVASVAKKSLKDAPCDDPRAPLSGLMAHVQTVAAVLDGERFVAAAFSCRSRTASTAGGFSIATTASPPAGIPHCNSASSDVSVEIVSHIPSTDTPAFAAVALLACPIAVCLAVAFSVELTDLDWGSWEGSLPESSSLGGDRTPLRGVFIMVSRDSRTHCGKNSISFAGPATSSPPPTRGGLAPCGPPKWPILSPPPTR